jgi:hypothetical protein
MIDSACRELLRKAGAGGMEFCPMQGLVDHYIVPLPGIVYLGGRVLNANLVAESVRICRMIGKISNEPTFQAVTH